MCLRCFGQLGYSPGEDGGDNDVYNSDYKYDAGDGSGSRGGAYEW